MEKIYSNQTLVGIKISSIADGTQAITETKESLQVLSLKYPTGTAIKAHAHSPTRRITENLQESLFVKKGKIKIEVYGPDKKKIQEVILTSGEVFVLLHGFWAIHFLEESEVIEIKNGPFKNDKIPF
jgi:hypothetical protein